MNADLAGLPTGLLAELQRVIPDFTLVGSFARDYRVHVEAGLPPGDQTLDVDVAILVPTLGAYRERLASLTGPGWSGIGFHLLGTDVDVIPYGSGIAIDGVVGTADGVFLDVTGMQESADSAEEVKIDGVTVRVPTLASLIGLKLIAWSFRRKDTRKDARDLGPLLEATYPASGPGADALWGDLDAGQRWDYDDALMGPYRAGRELATNWSSSGLHKLRTILQEPQRHELEADIRQTHPHFRGPLREQLAALREGMVS